MKQYLAREEMFSLVKKYEERTCTQIKFCETHQIKLATLSYWITLYRKSTKQTKTSNGFIPIKLIGDSSSRGEEATFSLPSGVRVSIPASYLSSGFASFIKALV